MQGRTLQALTGRCLPQVISILYRSETYGAAKFLIGILPLLKSCDGWWKIISSLSCKPKLLQHQAVFIRWTYRLGL